MRSRDSLPLAPLVLVPLAALSACSTAPHAAHWSYAGPDGPEHWSQLDPSFRPCASGQEQSPVELPENTLTPEPSDPQFDYHPADGRLVDNGHALEVDLAPASQLVLDGEAYTLVQFHFHAPSEHHVGPRAFPLELHLVHRAKDGAYAVVAVFIDEGEENPALGQLLATLPPELHGAAPEHGLDPNLLVPRDAPLYRYAGSLTTPPCTEGVLWNVFAAPIHASHRFIERVQHFHDHNARPVQPLYGRTIHG